MIPDQVCAKYAESGLKLKVTADHEAIFIEGQPEALKFLSELILAVGDTKNADCGFEISPQDVGKIFFDKKSTHALYIHRLPCKHQP